MNSYVNIGYNFTCKEQDSGTVCWNECNENKENMDIISLLLATDVCLEMLLRVYNT
jgi:hypothetical protein